METEQVLIINGLLQEAECKPSPNHDPRPPGSSIDLLVIHNISLPPGQFGGDAIERLFTNRLAADGHPYFHEVSHLRVSAHLLIRRNGSLLQFVAFHHRAWHAGVSCFKGKNNCNDFSIGIELEGTDDIPFQPAQYAALARVTLALQRLYPAIASDRIVGHSDIAPGRKTDPGSAFDWRYFGELLASGLLRQPEPG